MSRSHEYFALRNAEGRLAEVINDIQRIRASQSFMLDEQFFKGLRDLMDSYGYDSKQVAKLLLARDPDINSPKHDYATMLYLNHLSELIEIGQGADELERIDYEDSNADNERDFNPTINARKNASEVV